ncbi:MAG: hypothetical protein RL885_18655 [Planctomycetota bacterium]
MTTRCESCSMTIESGSYCQYCADDSGCLHPFEEVFERFLQWTRRQEPDLAEDEARRKTLAFMATRPAWASHPAVSK